MSLTARDVTKNQAAFDLDRKKLLVASNSFFNGDYANISGALESVALGQLMGRVSATGKLVVCKSAAVDGSQFPVGIMLDVLTDVAIAGTVDGINLVNGGKVREDMLVLDGTDTLDTVVDGRTMRDQLILNSKDLELVTVEDDTNFDN